MRHSTAVDDPKAHLYTWYQAQQTHVDMSEVTAMQGFQNAGFPQGVEVTGEFPQLAGNHLRFRFFQPKPW